MTTIPVEQLSFTFDASVVPFQYEVAGVCIAGWPQGAKAVDVVAHDLPVPAQCTWLIEAKDYWVITKPPKPTNLTGLAATVEAKVRDSLAALPVVGVQSTDAAAKAHANLAAVAPAIRVVLHLQPIHHRGSMRPYSLRVGFPTYCCSCELILLTLIAILSFSTLPVQPRPTFPGL
jgi:hypothetical protein